MPDFMRISSPTGTRARPSTAWTRTGTSLTADSDPAAPSGWLAEELRMFCRVARGAVPPPGTRFEDGVRLLGWLERLEAAAQHGA